MKLRAIREDHDIIRRVINKGMVLIAEAAGETEQLRNLIKNPNNEKKKGFIRNLWDKHKRKIATAGLGIAGILALILSGISLSSLIPIFGIRMIGQAMNQTISQVSENPSQNPEIAKKMGQIPTGAVYILPGENYYMKDGNGLVRKSIEEIDAYVKTLNTEQGEYLTLFTDPRARVSDEMPIKQMLHNYNMANTPHLYDLFSEDEPTGTDDTSKFDYPDEVNGVTGLGHEGSDWYIE